MSAAERLPQPEIGAPPAWSFPSPARAQLSNGVDVLVFERPGQYVISAHLIFDAPLSVEDPALEGVATICARTLDEGTAAHAGEEYAELLETEGAGFGIDVSLSGLQAVLDVPASRLDAAFALFAEAVREPAFGADDVERHVKLRLAEIEQTQANSAQLATTAYRRAVFASASRASRMNGGRSETVAAVTPEAVRAFHANYFGPRGTTLVLAGEFGSDPLALAERHLGDWVNPDQVQPRHQRPEPGRRTAVLIDRPGAVQADVRLGSFGPDRRDPRWADLSVASYAMGGAFLSRLNAVLREEKGYTYGVRLNFAPLRSGGSYAVQGSFRTEVAVDAIREARELLDVSAAPFTLEEVEGAISFSTGLSPLRYATADGVADQAATQILAELPDDYVDRSLAELQAVTPESATEAYRSAVDLGDLSLVVVGHAEQLADGLIEQGFALEVVTPDWATG